MPMALRAQPVRRRTVTLLPWAWASTAGSVIATPLANLVMVEGATVLLALAFTLYVVVACSLPGLAKVRPCSFSGNGTLKGTWWHGGVRAGIKINEMDRRAAMAQLLARRRSPGQGRERPPRTMDLRGLFSTAMRPPAGARSPDQWGDRARKRACWPPSTRFCRITSLPDPGVMRAFTEVPRGTTTTLRRADTDFAAAAYGTTFKPWRIGSLGWRCRTIAAGLHDAALPAQARRGGRSSRHRLGLPGLDPVAHHRQGLLDRDRRAARQRWRRSSKPLGYDNIETRVGDGYYGWPEVEAASIS